MKKRLTIASAALFVLVLTGCGADVNNNSKPAADVMNATKNVTRNPANGRVADKSHVQLATKIANGLVKKGYAKNAFAFVVGDSAYVAVTQKGKSKTNLGLAQKNKIGTAVKRIDNRIHHVYVSANPDVYQRFQSFANDVQAGKPISGIWDNFQTLVARVFPTTH